MSDSRIPAAIDALVTLFDTVEDLKVYDGAFLTGEEPAERVYVGYDGDPDSDFSAASGDQDWAGSVGTGRRDEVFAITCAVLVRNGAGNIKAARTAAYDVLAQLSTKLRDDPSLGFPPPSTAQMQNQRLNQYQARTGVEVRIMFDVVVQTRI